MSRPLTALWASAAVVAALAFEPAAALEAVAGTQLVMHVGPGADHPGIATIPAETRLTVHGCSEAEGWCLVRFGRRHGWIEGESLNVVGFSRPPRRSVEAVFAPPAPRPVLVPVPLGPDAALPPFLTADDVIVGMGEQFGLAAIAPGARAKPFGPRSRHRTGLAFRHHDFKDGIHVRRHGHFRHRHLDKHAFHPGKAVHFDHRRFGRFHGHPGKDLRFGNARFGKDFHVSRGRFGRRGHFALHSRGADRGGHMASGHFKHHFGKRRNFFGHAGAGSFGGLRIKGGWRP